MYGLINFSVIDTSNGANNAFSPPENFEGDYVIFLRDRFKNDPGARQHIIIVSKLMMRDGLEISFIGINARDAINVCKKIAASYFK